MFGNVRTALHLVAKHRLDWRYVSKILSLVLVSGLTEPLRIVERGRYRSKIQDVTIEHDPIFIIGHWRSGTTLLHHLLSLD